MDNTQIRLAVDEIFDQVVAAFPDELAAIIKEKTYIAGGCFKSLVLDEKVNDWDFWFRDQESVDKFKTLFNTLDYTKSSALTNRDNLKIKKILVKTDNAYTIKFPKETVQFVFTMIGKPADVVGKFDFRHTQNYYDPVSGVLECSTYPMFSKELIYNSKTPTPLSSLRRAFKFVKQGWTLPDSQLEYIVKDLVGVDWKQPEEVKKQVKGLYTPSGTSIPRNYGQINVESEPVFAPEATVNVTQAIPTFQWNTAPDITGLFGDGLT